MNIHLQLRFHMCLVIFVIVRIVAPSLHGEVLQ